jgi:hypothetical protein
VEREDSDKTTVQIHRDALLGLLDRSVAEPAPLAHTVSRAQLRARAVTRNETPTAEREAQAPVEPLDIDLTPSLSPWLVAAVIALLLVVFIAAAHIR